MKTLPPLWKLRLTQGFEQASSLLRRLPVPRQPHLSLMWLIATVKTPKLYSAVNSTAKPAKAAHKIHVAMADQGRLPSKLQDQWQTLFWGAV